MKLVGERRAVASSVLVFFAFLYGISAFLGDPTLRTMATAIAAVYGLGFFAVVAGYFWARWYALGVGLFGTLVSALGIWQAGPEPVLLVFGGAHLAAVLALSGEAMKGPYEGQAQWRERFHMDEHGVNRLGSSVIRASIGLPIILIYALAPKGGNGMMLAAAVLTAFGLSGLVRLRTWGVLAIGSAALVAAGAAMLGTEQVLPAATLLAAATAPFAGVLVRALRSS
jgi:hypothetical protein